MALHDKPSHPGSCCHPRRRRIRPISYNNVECHFVEIRPKRMLRIQHINARPRDPHFDQEMQIHSVYKNQGLHADVQSSGPLSMPAKRSAAKGSPPRGLALLPNALQEDSAEGRSKFQTQNVLESFGAGDTSLESCMQIGMHNTVAYVDCTVVSTSELHQVDESNNGEYNVLKKISNTNSNIHSSQTSSEKGCIGPINQPEHICDNHLRKNSLVSAGEYVSEKQSSTHNLHSLNHSHPMNDFPTMTNGHSKTGGHMQERSSTHYVPTSFSESGHMVLFFIHGVGGSSDVWQAQMRYFAIRGYEIIAPDLIGHGFSCTPQHAKAYHFNEIAADLEEIFDKYCKKKNVIISHSYGCSFACLLARRRSRRVYKLVLISGGGPTPLAPQPGIFSLPICLLYCLKPCLNCGFKKSAFHKKRKPIIDKNEAFVIPTYVLQHTMNGQDWPDGDEVYHQWLVCETLIIYGEQDRLVTLQEEKNMAEVIFHSHLEVIPDASHMVMIEAPDEVNRLIGNFLTKTSSNESPSSPVNDERAASRLSSKSTSSKSQKSLPHHLLQNSLKE